MCKEQSAIDLSLPFPDWWPTKTLGLKSVCPKCEGKEISVKFNPMQDRRGLEWAVWRVGPQVEMMKRECEACKFYWFEWPLDREEDE